MFKGIRRAGLIALVPALAVAAPRGHRKPKPKPVVTEPKATEPKPAEGSGSGSGSATGSGSGSGSDTTPATTTTPPTTPATPAPAPATSTTPPAPAEAETKVEAAGDVDQLRQEYLALRDELFKSRARANAVASQLYSTRMEIKFTWGSARYYGVSKASIRLDGATVFEDTGGKIAGDDGVRFEGYVAPGRHLVTFHVEATGKDDDSFTSATESQIAVKAVAGKDLLVAAKGKDSGDIAYEWKKSEHGSYGLGIDVSVKSVAQGGGKK